MTTAFTRLRDFIGQKMRMSHIYQQAPLPRCAATHVQRRERLGGLLNFYHREAA